MRIDTLTDTIGLGDLVCDECGGGVDATTETAPVRLLNVVSLTRRQFRVCDDCLEGLRNVIRKQRGRRPLSPRSRRALARLAQTPAESMSYADLAGSIGKYATNVILTLEERKLIERRLEDLNAGRDVRSSRYMLTPAGAAAIDTLELAHK